MAKHRIGTLTLLAVTCVYVFYCIIIPVTSGPISITFLATPALSLIILFTILSGGIKESRFINRASAYLYLSTAIVALAVVLAAVNAADGLVTSVSGMLLLLLIAVVIDKNRANKTPMSG